MSFFDDASLAFLPSGAAGKDGKAYSIKPTDGTGDFTFSRGSNLAATRVNASGLIEKGRENLWLQSTDLDTSPNATTSAASITGGQSGYDGSSNAWELESLSDGFYRRLYQSATQTGVITFSIYAKSANTDSLLIYNNQNGDRAWFDLSNGSLGNLNGAIDSSIEDIGNGWYRCSISLITSASSEFWICPTNGNNVASCDLGNSIYLQSAQLEIGLAATNYIESGASTGKAGLLEDEPRFDYSGGATCPSLLLEGSRTNLITQSEYFGGTTYTKDNASITDNDTTSPEGLVNAALLTNNTTNGQHKLVYDGISVTSGTDYVASIYFKSNDAQWIRVQSGGSPFGGFYWQNFDIINGVKGDRGSNVTTDSANIFDVGNGWYRCDLLITAASTGTSAQIQIRILESDDPRTTPSFAGTGLSAHLYGLQLEAASYPTSYIPNHSGSGSVTRGADDISTLDISSILGNDSYTIFLDVETENIGSSTNVAGDIFYLSVGSQTLAIDTRVSVIQDDSSSTTRIKVDVGDDITHYKAALKVTPTSATIFGNGIEGQSGTSRGLSPTSFNFYYSNKLKYNKILFFPEALSDADCVTLTTL